MKRVRYLIPVLAVCLIIFLLFMLVKQPADDGIEILGQRYSPTLRALYERVCALHQKPIKVIEIKGVVDDSIETMHDKEIVLRLHKGSSEDNIAHELMHAIMHAEGYPDFFCISTPLSINILKFCRGDLDHIIINDRLLELGYDARQGFLKEANGYDSVLRLHFDENPNNQAVLYFGMLHELIKFHFYIGIPSAQTDILERFPEVAKYWQKLSSSIDSLPTKPDPQDMWNIGVKYITLGDAICADLGASIRISDLIGLEPVPLRRDQLNKPSKSMFTQSIEDAETVPASQGWILVRTFLIDTRIMVSAALTLADSARVKEVDQLNVKELLRERNIRYILVD